MVSSPLDLTPEGSVDVPGLSVATAMRSATNSRAGSIYDSDLAACVPIHTVPISDSDYLVFFSRRWTDGVPSPALTGYYLSYTIDNTPGWMIVNGPNGLRRPVVDTYDIPMSTPHDAAVLTAACSRPPGSTYLLNTVIYGDTTSAVLQHVAYNPAIQTISTLSEEAIPDGHLSGPPVAFVYNLPSINNLILTPDVTAKIFTGQVTMWDDPAIAAINTGITLPSLEITPVYRSDTCDTNGKLQSFLDANSTFWDRGIGNDFTGTGTPIAGAQAVVTEVETTEGAITYAEKPLAAQSSYPSARVGTITIRFDRGVFLHGTHIIVLGSSAAGKVCMARKQWGRVGIPASEWEYYTGKGWDTDPTEVQQVKTTGGKLTTAGPISAFSFEQNRIRVATVTATGSQRYAQVYSMTNAYELKPAGVPLLIGSTADGSYQNGTLQFQPQLRVVEALIDTPEASTAIPYCYTRKVFSGGTSALNVSWGAWQISRLY